MTGNNHFVIREKLPSLNEVISANRTDKHKGAKLKRRVQDEIGQYIRIAVQQGHAYVQHNRCIVSVIWHEKTKRRDADNVESAVKFILDAMVEQGIIKDDSRKYVAQVYHHIVDDDEDYVEVFINDCV